jgi:hypothetical protein
MKIFIIYDLVVEEVTMWFFNGHKWRLFNCLDVNGLNRRKFWCNTADRLVTMDPTTGEYFAVDTGFNDRCVGVA